LSPKKQTKKKVGTNKASSAPKNGGIKAGVTKAGSKTPSVKPPSVKSSVAKASAAKASAAKGSVAKGPADKASASNASASKPAAAKASASKAASAKAGVSKAAAVPVSDGPTGSAKSTKQAVAKLTKVSGSKTAAAKGAGSSADNVKLTAKESGPAPKRTKGEVASKAQKAVTVKGAAEETLTGNGTVGKRATGKRESGKAGSGKAGSGKAVEVTNATADMPKKKRAAQPGKKENPVVKRDVVPMSTGAVDHVSSSRMPQAAEPAAPRKVEDYSKFRLKLLAIRERLKGDVQMMSQEALGTADGAVDNHAPIHPAEVGSHAFEQEFTLNLLSSDGDRLGQIDAALEKIADGTYGSCEECGGRIPKARLEIIPDTPFCVKCASMLEG
jgi:DnaK suppressor protein